MVLSDQSLVIKLIGQFSFNCIGVILHTFVGLTEYPISPISFEQTKLDKLQRVFWEISLTFNCLHAQGVMQVYILVTGRHERDQILTTESPITIGYK